MSNCSIPSSSIAIQSNVENNLDRFWNGEYSPGADDALCKVSLSVDNSVAPQVALRSLTPQDKPTVQYLCKQWFPIEYPDEWYDDICNASNTKRQFISIVATLPLEGIIGLIVAEIKTPDQCNEEDQGILWDRFQNPTVTYILTLGVVNEFRRHGIASLLLSRLLKHVSHPLFRCYAVFLHVLRTNTGAISFYEKQRFRRHAILPRYYTVCGVSQPQDGASYVLYINGGRGPFSVVDWVKEWLNKVVHSLSLVQYLLPQHIIRALVHFVSQRRRILRSVVLR